MSESMSWDVREAIALVDQLLATFQPGSFQGDETVTQAKVLWQQDQQREAFDLLVQLVQTFGSKTCDTSPTLRKVKDLMEKVGFQVDTQDNKILQLEQRNKRQDQHIHRQDKRIEDLEQKNKRADAARAKKRQRILLGQAAYALSKIIEGYIFGSAGFPGGLGLPVSLKQIQKRAADFTQEQTQRWQAVQNHVSSIMSVEELLAADKALRTARFDDAHGSSSEVQQVTLQDLKTWAGVHFPPGAVVPVQNYVKVLDNFSSRNKPLVPDVKPSNVIH